MYNDRFAYTVRRSTLLVAVADREDLRSTSVGVSVESKAIRREWNNG